jgi:hypothetical protein
VNTKQLLSKLAQTNGPLSVKSGVLRFEDGAFVDLTILASNAAAAPVAITLESESLGRLIVIAPDGLGVVEAEALAHKVSTTLKPAGRAGELDQVLEAFETAGFTLPTYATVGLLA